MAKGMNKPKQEPRCCIVCGTRTRLLTRYLRHQKRNDICGFLVVCDVHKEYIKEMSLQKRKVPGKEEIKIIKPPIIKKILTPSFMKKNHP